jgi:2-C-methyl-D-erythritol 4-phosphate cytidylyltransferase
VLAALPVTDTLKEVAADGTVLATPDRARFWQAQTPQGFPRAVILEAHRRARAEGVRATDDAALCERYGIPVRVVEGAADNLKVTRPADLAVAEALARRLPG